MKGLLVIIIFLAVVTGAAYGFAATLAIMSVDDIGNQTETVSFDSVTVPTSCTMSGGINCTLN